jgi:hypothetical protein
VIAALICRIRGHEWVRVTRAQYEDHGITHTHSAWRCMRCGQVRLTIEGVR